MKAVILWDEDFRRNFPKAKADDRNWGEADFVAYDEDIFPLRD